MDKRYFRQQHGLIFVVARWKWQR